MSNIVAIVLAAGRGTRMKSDLPKVMHDILGKPVIMHVLDSLKEAGLKEMIVVAGYGIDLLKKALKGTKVVEQKKLLGSGDACIAAKKALEKYSGDVLIACGDTPLIQGGTVKALLEKHEESEADLTVLTTEVKDPTGYGRIVRGPDGRVSRIVEEEEARLFEEVITEINVGLYCIDVKDLFEALSEVKNDNEKGEYFLTDIVAIMHKKGKVIESVPASGPEETIGVNTKRDLADATLIMKEGVLDELMSGGVTIEDPFTTTIYPGVRIGRDTVIHPNTVIEQDVEIGTSCSIGPFARIRPGVVIAGNVEVGNFVELVRTEIGDDTKIKHHTYLGDAVVGKGVNVGAGTITANFDGKAKHKTVIEDGAFIGVGAILIAPVKIGKGAVVGAGSVVPKGHDVPKGATVVGIPARVLHKRR